MSVRPDYCPLGNEPCQAMCDVPCGKSRLLTALERIVQIGSTKGYGIRASAEMVKVAEAALAKARGAA